MIKSHSQANVHKTEGQLQASPVSGLPPKATDAHTDAKSNKPPTRSYLVRKSSSYSSKKSVKSSKQMEGGAPEMKPLEMLKCEDPGEIYCIGDNSNILKFAIGAMEWNKIPLSTDKRCLEAFDGTTRYSSSCFALPDRIFLTGGCYCINNFPTSSVAEFRVTEIYKPIKKK